MCPFFQYLGYYKNIADKYMFQVIRKKTMLYCKCCPDQMFNACPKLTIRAPERRKLMSFCCPYCERLQSWSLCFGKLLCFSAGLFRHKLNRT